MTLMVMITMIDLMDGLWKGTADDADGYDNYERSVWMACGREPQMAQMTQMDLFGWSEEGEPCLRQAGRR